MIKYVLIVLLVVPLFAVSRVENTFVCIDDKLFIQTTVIDYKEIKSASLVLVLSQWGSHLAVTACKTPRVKVAK